MQFLRYLYACRNQVFFDFSKYLRNFQNRKELFSSYAKSYFLQRVRYIQWNLLDLIFSQKIAGFCLVINPKLKKVGVSRLIAGTPPTSFQCYLLLSIWCVCVCVCVCVFCLFTPSLSVLFVFHRKNLVFVPNVQIYGFYKWEIFKKKRHWKRNFWYQWIIQCNTDSCCEHMTDGVNIYLQRCASLLVWVCCVSLCVCVCVWYQNREPAKNHTMCQTSVNLMPCCIECISRSLWYQGTKAPHLQIHNIIKWNNGMITHSVKEIRYQK